MPRPLFALLFASAALAADPPAKDALGDPLPKGAIARLGTERMRHAGNVFSGFLLHPDGKRLISTVRGKMVSIDPATGGVLDPFGGAATALPTSFSADGKRAVSGSNLEFVVWETDNGGDLFRLKTPANSGLVTPHLSGDGKFAIAGMDGFGGARTGLTVLVYDVDGKKEHARLKVAQSDAAFGRLSGDGTRAVTWGRHHQQAAPGREADPDRTPAQQVQFWNVTAGKELASAWVPGEFGVTAAAIAPDGKVAAASGSDGVVRLFEADTGKKLWELIARGRVGEVITFSPDGKAVAAAGPNGAVQLWEVATGKPLGRCPKVPAVPVGVVFTGPDTAVALGYSPNPTSGVTGLVWEVPTGKVISPVGGHRHPVSGVAFVADDKEVLTCASHAELFRWNTAGEQLGPVALTAVPPLYPGAKPHLEPGGGRVVWPDADGLGVYDTATGKFVLPVPPGEEPAIGWSADGKRMVVGGGSRNSNRQKATSVRLIDTDTGVVAAEVPVGVGGAVAVGVCPDGAKGAAVRLTHPLNGGVKAALYGFDMKAGKVLCEVDLGTSFNTWTPAMAVCPDGESAVVTRPGVVGLTVYDLATGTKGKHLSEVKGKRGVVPAFSPDGKRLAVAADAEFGGGARIEVFEWPAMKLTHTFIGHSTGPTVLAFSKGGKTLASGSFDGTVLLWDVRE